MDNPYCQSYRLFAFSFNARENAYIIIFKPTRGISIADIMWLGYFRTVNCFTQQIVLLSKVLATLTLKWSQNIKVWGNEIFSKVKLLSAFNFGEF